jgi:hypothetical protein
MATTTSITPRATTSPIATGATTTPIAPGAEQNRERGNWRAGSGHHSPLSSKKTSGLPENLKSP